jgi:hypothetical protein
MKNLVAIACSILLLGAVGAQAATQHAREISATVLVLEGEVTAIYERPAEGGLEVIGASLLCGDETHEILLAPQTALQEVGFRIEIGDTVRVRLFASEDDDSLRVQKILNRTRGDMVRLRTLRMDPLWDGTGNWNGSHSVAGEHIGGTQDRGASGAGPRGGR